MSLDKQKIVETNVGLRSANPTYGIGLVEYSLKSLCLLVADCPHATPKWTENGVIVLRNQNIKGGRLDLSSPSYTDEEHYQGRIKRANPREDDIVITREAPMGDVCLIPKGLKCCLGQRQVLLRPNPEIIESRYLLYALQAPYIQNQISWNEGTGSTVSNLRIPVLEALKVPTPPISTQIEISTLLGALDDRIALLRETNATLEAIAQALFKSWFVDFDPVHAKQQGREPEGMDADTAALFPDGFKDSELGVVPRGWRVSTIDQVTSLIIDYRGKTPKKLGRDWANSGIPAVSAKNIKRGRLVEKQAMNFVDNDLFDIWMKDKLESGDILMTSEAPLGELLYLADEHNFCLSQRVFALRANSTNCLSSFLYFWLSSKNVQEHLAARATGTTVVGIRQSELRKIEVLLPPLPIQEKANDILRTCLLRIEKNEAEKESLTTLRDTLLPRLISGQFRLPDAEEAVV
jgi:type I restriction enzyme S subunit